MGMQTFTPYENPIKDYSSVKFGSFAVQAFDLATKDGKWTHTNSDGTECPCYGFYITHPDMGSMVYITDTNLVKWRFKGINHILISCNYMEKYLADDEAKRNHVLRGHMELETVKEFVRTNKSEALQNVILCHLSGDNSNGEEMVAEVQEAAGNDIYVDYAAAGKRWTLRKKGECPF